MVSDNDKAHFNQRGYVTLKNVFNSEELNVFNEWDGFDEKHNNKSHLVINPSPKQIIDIQNIFKKPILVDFSSFALKAKHKVSLIELAVTAPENNVAGDDGSLFKFGFCKANGIGVHRDGGWIDRDLNIDFPPMLTLKAAIWLTDISSSQGNMRVFDGSHAMSTNDIQELNINKAIYTDITANVGDVTFFDRRLLHTRTWNRSGCTRKVLFVEYSVTWIKRKQYMGIMAHQSIDEICNLSPVLELSEPWGNYWP